MASGGGVCMMNTAWKKEHHPSSINFISSFLCANSFRLNFVPIAPDFIFNCGGLSVAFVFATNCSHSNIFSMYKRVQKLKEQFANLCVVVILPTNEQNEFVIRSYFKHCIKSGKPTFVPVQDLEMGFEKMVKIALVRGAPYFAECKRQDIILKLKAELELSVHSMDLLLKVLTSVPGIDSHGVNALIQGIGSIEAIAKASSEDILENTDLSAEKAELIRRFFRDPMFYLTSKIN